MKKTIKIRFIKEDGKFFIQRKKLFRWSYIKSEHASFGGSCYVPYKDKNKNKLLKTILDKEFNTTLNRIKIIEYPTIKKY